MPGRQSDGKQKVSSLLLLLILMKNSNPVRIIFQFTPIFAHSPRTPRGKS